MTTTTCSPQGPGSRTSGATSTMVNLDTHVFIDALEERIRPSERRALDDFWVISGIVFWELAMLERAGRITPMLDSEILVKALPRITVYEIDREVAGAIRRLDFRSDPADELIAATSL